MVAHSAVHECMCVLGAVTMLMLKVGGGGLINVKVPPPGRKAPPQVDTIIVFWNNDLCNYTVSVTNALTNHSTDLLSSSHPGTVEAQLVLGNVINFNDPLVAVTIATIFSTPNSGRSIEGH